MLELPASLDPLGVELRGQGFQTTNSRYEPASFGNGLLELTNAAGQRVRFVRDRGQWWIEIMVDSAWQDPYMVVLALDKAKYVRRALSHEEQVRYTREALNRLADNRVDRGELLAEIARLRAADWKDRYDQSLD